MGGIALLKVVQVNNSATFFDPTSSCTSNEILSTKQAQEVPTLRLSIPGRCALCGRTRTGTAPPPRDAGAAEPGRGRLPEAGRAQACTVWWPALRHDRAIILGRFGHVFAKSFTSPAAASLHFIKRDPLDFRTHPARPDHCQTSASSSGAGTSRAHHACGAKHLHQIIGTLNHEAKNLPLRLCANARKSIVRECTCSSIPTWC